MVERMKCGHSVGYMYRIRDTDSKVKKFCMACLIEAIGLKDADGQVPHKTSE